MQILICIFLWETTNLPARAFTWTPAHHYTEMTFLVKTIFSWQYGSKQFSVWLPKQFPLFFCDYFFLESVWFAPQGQQSCFMLACSKHEVSLFLAHPWASLKASASVLHEANKHRAHSACAGTFICRARLGHLLLGAFPMETHAGKTVLGKSPGGSKESRSLPCTVILHVMTEFQITQSLM